MIFKILFRSITATFQQKRMMSLLWFVSFMFALPGFWVMHRSLHSYFGSRHVASEWLHQFNFNYLLEMINDLPTITQTFSSLVFGSVLLFLLVSVFLSGGIVGKLIQTVSGNTAGEENFAASFFGFSGKFFFRFLRVFMWTLLLSIMSFLFMMIGGYAGFITAVLVAVWIMTSDITKIRLVSDDSYKVTKTFFASFVWIIKNFPSVASVYLMNFLLLVIGFAVYKLLDNVMIPDSGMKIFLMLLLQQCFVFFRGAIRIQMFNSAILLWNAKLTMSEPASSNPTEISSDQQTQPV